MSNPMFSGFFSSTPNTLSAEYLKSADEEDKNSSVSEPVGEKNIPVFEDIPISSGRVYATENTEKIRRMKFLDYCKQCIQKGAEFNLNVGDVDIPETVLFYDDAEITDYCLQKFGKLLNADCEVYDNNVEVFCDDYLLGRKFVDSILGYISNTEMFKLFNVMI